MTKLVSTSPTSFPMPRLSAHEVKIAELERMVGKQTMELEFKRGALRGTPLQRRGIYLATQMRTTFRATSLLCAQWIDRCTGEIFLGKLA